MSSDFRRLTRSFAFIFLSVCCLREALANNPSPWSFESGVDASPGPPSGGDPPPGAPCPPGSGCQLASPFFAATGAFQYPATDLEISGAGFPLKLERTYHSLAKLNGYFGPKWRLWYESRVLSVRTGSRFGPDLKTDYRVVVMPGGTVRRYQCIGNGPDPCELFFNPPGVEDDLRVSTEIGYSYVIKEVTTGLIYKFRTDGNLGRIEDRRGRFVQLSYTGGPGKILTQVVNDAGDFISFQTIAGRIQSVVDSGGRQVSYQYDSVGNLSAVIDPIGQVWTYLYLQPGMPNSLTHIRDPFGRDLQRVTYYSPHWFASLLTFPDKPNHHPTAPDCWDNFDCCGSGDPASCSGTSSCSLACFGHKPDGTALCTSFFDNVQRLSSTYNGAVKTYFDEGRSVEVAYFDTEFTGRSPGECEVVSANPLAPVVIKYVGGHVERLSAESTRNQITGRTKPDGRRVIYDPGAGEPGSISEYAANGDTLKTTILTYLSTGPGRSSGLVTGITLLDATSAFSNTAITYEPAPSHDFYDASLVATDRLPRTKTIFATDSINSPDWTAPQEIHRVHPNGESSGDDILSTTTYLDAAHFHEVDSVADAAGAITQYTYSPGSRDVIQVSLPPNDDLETPRSISYTTDSLHRVTQSQSPTGETTCSHFDALGRVTSIDAPDPASPGNCNSSRFKTTIFYQKQGSPLPPGLTNPCAFNQGAGNPSNLTGTATTDPNGHTTWQCHDAYGHLRSVYDAAGSVTTYQYDGPELTRVTDANGNRTSYTYDVNDRLSTVVDETRGTSTPLTVTLCDGSSGAGLSGTTRYCYDNFDRLSRLIDPRGVRTDYAYDSKDRITAKTITPPSSPSAVVRYTYDTDPNPNVLTTVEDGLAEEIGTIGPVTTSFVYDWQLRPTQISHHGATETRQYGSRDEVISRWVDLGNPEGRFYYPDGSLETVVPVGRGSDGYIYDASGRLTGVTHTERASQHASPTDIIRKTDYDTSGRISGIEHYAVKNADRICIRLDQYTYDEPDAAIGPQIGLLTSATSLMFDDRGNGTSATRHFSYDSLYRIARVDYPSLPPLPSNESRFLDLDNVSEFFGYDSIGNRVTRSIIDHKNNDMNYTLAYQYSPSSGNSAKHSQLLSGTSGSVPVAGNQEVDYRYDAAGNLTGRTETLSGGTNAFSFSWDPLGRLAGITDQSGAVLASYRQDYDGFRFFVQERSRASAPLTSVTNYSFGEADTIVSQGDFGQVQFYDAPGIDNRGTIAFNVGLDITPGRLFLTDQVGSVIGSVVSNNVAGSVAERRYDVFGRLASRQDEPSEFARHGFTGRDFASPFEQSPEGLAVSGGGYPRLYYFRNRYYDPEVGRFLSPDPIAEMAVLPGFEYPNGGPSINDVVLHADPGHYVYALNRPTMFRDPTGLYTDQGCVAAWDKALAYRLGVCKKDYSGRNDTCNFDWLTCSVTPGVTIPTCNRYYKGCVVQSLFDYTSCQLRAEKSYNKGVRNCTCNPPRKPKPWEEEGYFFAGGGG